MALKVRRLLLPFALALALLGLFVSGLKADPLPLITNSDFDTDVSGWFMRGDSPCGSMPTWESPGRANLSCHVDFSYVSHEFTIPPELVGETITVSWFLNKAGSSAGSFIAVEIRYNDAEDELWDRTNIAGNWESEESWIPGAAGLYTITVKLNHQDSWIDYVRVMGFEEPEPPPDPGPDQPINTSATCSFSQTVVFTDSNGQGGTYPVTVTVPANLVQNYSFEAETNDTPAGWSFYNTTGGYYPDPQWYPSAAGGAWAYDPLNGVRHIAGWNYLGGVSNNDPSWDLGTNVELNRAGEYLTGFYAHCVATSGCTSYIDMYFNGELLVEPSSISGDYLPYTSTQTLSGGQSWLNLNFVSIGSSNKTILLDDVFVFPSDGAGGVLCEREYYDIPEVAPTTCMRDDLGNCIPIPQTGAGSVCYFCTMPNGQSLFSVPHWIAWLGCVIRNLFSCSLRIWLMNVVNAVNGATGYLRAFAAWLPTVGQDWVDWYAGQVIPAIRPLTTLLDSSTSYLSALVTWLPTTVQGYVNWYAAQVVPALQPVVVIYESGTNIFDLLIAFLIVLVRAIQAIIVVMLSLIGMITDLIAAVVAGLNTPAATIELPDGTRTIEESGLAVAGPSPDKILWLFMVGLTLIDQDVVPRFGQILILIVAVGGVGAIWWTIRYWENSVSV